MTSRLGWIAACLVTVVLWPTSGWAQPETDTETTA